MRRNESKSQYEFMTAIEKENIQAWINKWARIVAHNYPSRYRFDDAVQEIKLQVYEHYTRWYNSDRSALEKFVWAQTRQCAKAIIRAQDTKKRSLFGEVNMEWPDTIVDPHHAIQEKDLLYCFVKVDLERLGLYQEKIIIEHLRKGYTWEETGQYMGVNPMTVCRKMRKVRAIYG